LEAIYTRLNIECLLIILKWWSTIVATLLVMGNWNMMGKQPHGFVTLIHGGYFEVIAGLKELGHVALNELWYSLEGGSVLEDRLELLCDDKGVTHMANLARLNGVVHLYF